ncbi:MAG TPA: 30S ribosome-binding factor RbfA [Longimicrobiales bacterium]|nr:30S ribosome-binding factor RbfA [Longimicrobiales bacterium]
MASKRIARLNEQLKREIAELVRTDVRDPRVGLVSVTAVQVATDLGSARVFVRVLGGDRGRVESLEGLVAAAPFLRRALGQILHIRRIPELRFEEDRTMEHARRIEQILSEVLPGAPGTGREPDGGAGEGGEPEA